MQEEIENRTVNFVISTSRLTARSVINGMNAYVRYRQNRKFRQSRDGSCRVKGKQTLNQLREGGDGTHSVDIEETELKGFEKIARKYKIDYSVEKNYEEGKGYLIFFKAKDTNVIEQAQREYAAMKFPKTKDDRVSIKEQIAKYTEKALELFGMGKIRNRQSERSR